MCGKTEDGKYVVSKTDCGREVLLTNTTDDTLRFAKAKILDTSKKCMGELV